MANNNFQVTPSVQLTEYSELNFQSLYMYHTPLGSKANQVTIVDSKGPIGTTVANNWAVYDGPGPDAKVVARAQGLHIQDGNWVSSFSLVFENERFTGSTFEVMGITVESGEWAIVGGTGQFAMATGIITKKFHEQRSDGNIIQLAVRALCPLLKGIRYPITKIGPWGGSGGAPLDITEASKHLESVTIRSGFVIDSIEYSYVDHSCQNHTVGRWGGPGGSPHTFKLAPNEFITEVSGTVGKYYGPTIITSIKFVTNLGSSYGPWGELEEKNHTGTPFTVPVQPGSGVVGFFARGGDFLDAIGIYVGAL